MPNSDLGSRFTSVGGCFFINKSIKMFVVYLIFIGASGAEIVISSTTRFSTRSKYFF